LVAAVASMIVYVAVIGTVGFEIPPPCSPSVG
jgi:hypothetical protein